MIYLKSPLPSPCYCPICNLCMDETPSKSAFRRFARIFENKVWWLISSPFFYKECILGNIECIFVYDLNIATGGGRQGDGKHPCLQELLFSTGLKYGKWFGFQGLLCPAFNLLRPAIYQRQTLIGLRKYIPENIRSNPSDLHWFRLLPYSSCHPPGG
jgi:hypothetical protein